MSRPVRGGFFYPHCVIFCTCFAPGVLSNTDVRAEKSEVPGRAAVRLSRLCVSTLNRSIQSVLLDAEACDLILDGRARLDFGAGMRTGSTRDYWIGLIDTL
ncbi:hypothetical protein [Paraburkholderia dinghuensis]|uniref:Uncharacterized protein n=1 Tax=Paraburkholderia dinghuensis TaxID=2305225 RepID=A0A3N6PY57_9BURK|nr:hypothetical protein [Paraburkholderia dinghuensis]RQH04986.1 hypothetical protein D1Y85_16370 [Paraburkholderia dinghuensis]